MGYVFGQTNVRSIREVPRRTARKCGPPVDSPNRRSHTARDRPPGSTEASDEQCRASTTVVCTGGSPGSERQAGYIPVRWETESTRPHYDSVIEREYTARPRRGAIPSIGTAVGASSYIVLSDCDLCRSGAADEPSFETEVW